MAAEAVQKKKIGSARKADNNNIIEEAKSIGLRIKSPVKINNPFMKRATANTQTR